MEQIGTVTKVVGSMAHLTIERASACGEKCKSCAVGCEIKAHDIVVPNTLDAKVGDKVELNSKSSVVLKYVLIVYGVPFVFLIAGIFIGNYVLQQMGFSFHELGSLGIGAITMALGFLVVRGIDNRFPEKEKQIVFMVRIIDEYYE